MNRGQMLSVAGIVLGSAAWGALIITAGITALPAALNTGSLDNRLAALGGCLFWGGPLVALVGLAMGIAGAARRNPDGAGMLIGMALPGGALISAVLFFILASYAVWTLLSNQP